MFNAEKVDFLFRFVNGDVRNKLLLDDEAMYSTTDQITADKITTDLLRFIPSTGLVTDATACIGGNTYSFAQSYDKVLAFEKDEGRFKLLQHNLAALGVQNVEMRCGDAWDLCIQQNQDCIFIDPPWGGPEYKKLDKVDLYMSNQPLAKFCERAAKYTKFIALKAPTNFNEAKFLADTNMFMELIHKNTQLRKMHFMIFAIVSPNDEELAQRSK